MKSYLIIPLIAFLLSFFISYCMWNKKFAGQKFSKTHIGKYVWGFRHFLFPTINLFILLQYDLKAFCLSLLFWALVNNLLRVIFPKARKPNMFQNLGYVWYLFVASTLYLNDPFWIQIWPTLSALVIFLVAVTVLSLGKTTELTHKLYNTETLPETQILILSWMTPIVSLFILCVNEVVRTQFSFEVWAFYNAFYIPVYILVFFLGTIIIVPLMYRD